MILVVAALGNQHSWFPQSQVSVGVTVCYASAHGETIKGGVRRAHREGDTKVACQVPQMVTPPDAEGNSGV